MVGGYQSGSTWPVVQAGPGGYFPLANSSTSQVSGNFLANTSGLPYSVGGEDDMLYLGRSGSAERESQTVLGDGGGGAGGALSFPVSWRVGLLLPVGVGRDPPEECIDCGAMLGCWGEKGPEPLMGDGRQYRGGTPGLGEGLGVLGRNQGWQSEKTSRGFQLRGSRGQSRCGRSIAGSCRVGGGAFFLRWRGWRCLVV